MLCAGVTADRVTVILGHFHIGHGWQGLITAPTVCPFLLLHGNKTGWSWPMAILNKYRISQLPLQPGTAKCLSCSQCQVTRCALCTSEQEGMALSFPLLPLATGWSRPGVSHAGSRG